MSFRTCEGCGYKLPFGRRRNNIDGKMVCDGCCPDKPGNPHMPLGANASLQPPLPACAACRRPMGVEGLIRREGALVCAAGCTKVAHESPDSTVVSHCPMCGSGQITASSNGTIECGMCSTSFIVKIAPEFAATPQTIDVLGEDAPEPKGDDPKTLGLDDTEPDVEDLAPESDPDVDDKPAAKDKPKDSTDDEEKPKAKTSFKTASGASLSEEHYLRHVALQVTPDRVRTLREMSKR